MQSRFGLVAVFGIIFMITGVTLRCLSIYTLGSYFLNEVSLLPGQPLVTNGIYGLLRHPSEAGIIFLAFGGTMVLGSIVGLIASIILLLPCVFWRTRLEDSMLHYYYSGDFIAITVMYQLSFQE